MSEAISLRRVQNFWSKVQKRGPGLCWPWRGVIKPNRRGKLGVDWAPRLAWRIQRGPIPKGLYVCHTCDKGLCCNADHLFLGTQFDNMQDASRKGRMSRGEAHWTRRNPELVARGDRNGRVTTPSSYGIGQTCSWSLLNDRKVRWAREQRRRGKSIEMIAIKLQVSRACISKVIRGKTWKHVV